MSDENSTENDGTADLDALIRDIQKNKKVIEKEINILNGKIEEMKKEMG